MPVIARFPIEVGDGSVGDTFTEIPAELKAIPEGQLSGNAKGSGIGGISTNGCAQVFVLDGGVNENIVVPMDSIVGSVQPVEGMLPIGIGR